VALGAEVRPLAREDDRSGFSCGDAELDRFFEHYAGQNQFKLHLAVTYVAVVTGKIVGFATVAASSIERASIPSARMQKRLPACPLPVLRLARLGVDTRAQRHGIGKGLLRHVLAPCARAARSPWVRGRRDRRQARGCSVLRGPRLHAGPWCS
jgi:GNAT superfamily N-acetyltransferase